MTFFIDWLTRGKAPDGSGKRKAPALIISSVALALLVTAAAMHPSIGRAQDYPSGATTTGVVTQVWHVGSGVMRFLVQGTLDDGSSGTQAFFIDTTVAGGSFRAALILGAAAQGKTVHIWNYGQTESHGGLNGYTSATESVDYN